MTPKIFVVTHKHIFKDLYMGEDISNFTFVNISDDRIEEHYYKEYDVIDIKNESFVHLGKYYTESEVIYNVYKQKMYKGLTHIGFTHYDVGTKCLSTNNSLSCALNEPTIPFHINLQPFGFVWDYNQHILADESQPETLVGAGRNCYDYILEKYNTFYKTNISINDLIGQINLCSCFVLDINSFERMMGWVSWVIESRDLEKFDTLHRHRIQGGLLERFYAVWIRLNVSTNIVLNLDHMVHLKNY